MAVTEAWPPSNRGPCGCPSALHAKGRRTCNKKYGGGRLGASLPRPFRQGRHLQPDGDGGAPAAWRTKMMLLAQLDQHEGSDGAGAAALVVPASP